MNRNRFEWTLGAPPPRLQPHSAAKLSLIKHYLEQYFNTVTSIPQMEQLQISLIDGFCGGGVFEDSNGGNVSGTPMIMLQSIKDAEKRINQERHKKLTINARYYFIDKSKPATDYLKNEIQNTEFLSKIIDGSIQILPGKFEEKYEDIIRDIRLKAPAGRSIFLLDQCGYNRVPPSICRNILKSLPKSEIILTFAVGWLIDFVNTTPRYLKAVKPIGLNEEDIEKMIENKNNRNHRYMIQLVAEHLRHEIGAPYFTPFFLRSEEAHRDLLVIHLSKHPTARNVMVTGHWEIQNSSIHYGKAGLDMLGVEPKWIDAPPMDFGFDNSAEERTAKALREDIPYRMEDLDSHGAITHAAFLREIVNETPATYNQINGVLHYLHKEEVIKIWTPGGKSKKLEARLKDTDRIELARQSVFDIFKGPK